MKKRTRRLMRLLEHQQCICLELVKVIIKAYDQDNTATDESPTGKISKPDVHKPIQHIEPALEHYR